jgi:LmbE family N-acetylglucosaminyl deacetylase
MSKTSVLVIAAHPDDEVLGCGGAIGLHRDAGHSVTVVIATRGRSAEDSVSGQPQFTYTAAAMKVLDVTDFRFLGFPDQRMDTFGLTDIITPLEQIVREIQPSVVYLQYGGDVNHDHNVLFRAALVALRPQEEFLRTIYTFDTASSTEWAYPRTFIPDTWLDVTTSLDRKLAAMACYEPELRPFPHPRSCEALRHRAAAFGSMCCMQAAEIFMTVRRTIRNGQTPV